MAHRLLRGWGGGGDRVRGGGGIPIRGGLHAGAGGGRGRGEGAAVVLLNCSTADNNNYERECNNQTMQYRNGSNHQFVYFFKYSCCFYFVKNLMENCDTANNEKKDGELLASRFSPVSVTCSTDCYRNVINE